MTLFELTKILINIPSITEEEGQLAHFLSNYLKDAGFQVLQQEIGLTRKNILATMHQKPRVILNTHLDTVPPFIPAKEDETYIYGRGACDAKGIMAAMIFALINLKNEGVKEVGLLLVVGEETDSIGAKRANHLGLGSDYIIVGEPTSNTLGKGHRGLITLKLDASGKAAHSALPHLGESAIDKLIDALYKIRQLDLGKSELGQSSLNIGRINGGVAHNVVADAASSVISIRNSVPSETVIKKITESLNNLVEIDVLTQSEPQFTYTLPDMEQTILPFSTDIPYLKNFGKPLLIGPGSAEVAHTANEKIEKTQLNQAVDIYQDLTITLLN